MMGTECMSDIHKPCSSICSVFFLNKKCKKPMSPIYDNTFHLNFKLCFNFNHAKVPSYSPPKCHIFWIRDKIYPSHGLLESYHNYDSRQHSTYSEERLIHLLIPPVYINMYSEFVTVM